MTTITHKLTGLNGVRILRSLHWLERGKNKLTLHFVKSRMPAGMSGKQQMCRKVCDF